MFDTRMPLTEYFHLGETAGRCPKTLKEGTKVLGATEVATSGTGYSYPLAIRSVESSRWLIQMYGGVRMVGN